MNKLRWSMEGGLWEVDLSTPVTLDGVARAVACETVPLGLSRGPSLSRPKQIDFFQRFMAMPFVPSFSQGQGLSFQRLLSLPLPSVAAESWFPALLGQFNLHKFLTSLKRNGFRQQQSDASSLHSIWRHLSDPSFYALNFSSEWWLTPEDTLLFSIEVNGDNNTPRKKALLQHKFPHHNLTVEATSPALFVDHLGNYWDVPLTLGMDLASVASDSGISCHFCVNHISGSPKQHHGQPTNRPHPSLLPGLCAKCAVSFKKHFSIWKSQAPKAKMVQPYDILLSNPHISASALVGTVVTASVGDNSMRDESCGFWAKGENSAIFADSFASASLSAQHGNFQKPFLDLTRFSARMDIPCGSKFLSGASRIVFDLYNSQIPSAEAVEAICPEASFSFQQQIAGPFSLRIDSGVSFDQKNGWSLNMKEPVFALEYALQLLFSAKALAWYSPKQKEFMIELRFLEP